MKERQINAETNRMMSSRASSLLRRASGGFEPSASDKSKTRAAIARRVGVGLAAGAAVAAGAKSAAAAPSLAPAALAPAALAPAAITTAVTPAAVTTFAGVGFATKLVAAIAIVGTVSAGAVTVHHVTRATTPTTATTTASVTSPIQPPLPARVDMQQTAAPQMPTQQSAQQAAAPQTVVEPVAPAQNASPSPIANTLQNKPIHKIDTAAPALQTGAESELIQGAMRALQANDATKALALLNEHAQRFPNGALSEERDAARVIALCAAGQQSEAASAGAAFLSAHPDSMQAARVRSSCANGAAQ